MTLIIIKLARVWFITLLFQGMEKSWPYVVNERHRMNLWSKI